MPNPLYPELTPGKIADILDSIGDGYDTTVWHDHPEFSRILRARAEEIRQAPSFDVAYAILGSSAQYIQSIHIEHMRHQFTPPAELSGPDDIRTPIFITGTTAALNLVATYVARSQDENALLPDFVFAAMSPSWLVANPYATARTPVEISAILSAQNPIAAHHEAINEAMNVVLPLIEEVGDTQLANSLRGQITFLDMGAGLFARAVITPQGVGFSYDTVKDYSRNALKLYEAIVDEHPVRAGYVFLQAARGFEPYFDEPSIGDRARRGFQVYVEDAFNPLLNSADNPYLADYLISPSEVIFIYQLGADLARKIDRDDIALQFLRIVERESERALGNEGAHVAEVLQSAEAAATDSEFLRLTGQLKASNIPPALSDDMRELMGDWSPVDPADERLPKIEVVMARFGLSGKYTIEMLDQGLGEGTEMVVQVNVADLEVEGDPSAKFTTIEQLNQAFFDIDPMIGLGTSFEPPQEPFTR